MAVLVRDPPPLPGGLSDRRIGATLPFVSVIVPARNEAHNIAACVRSLGASDYPGFEVIVVDDRSDDGTGAVARAVETGRAARKIVVDGAPVPHGWFGKQWACWQGVQEARGEILLFTDADTLHGELLMARAVAGLHRDGADCLTIIGRQRMDSFWERLVQPQIFGLLALRYPLMGREPLDQRRWRSAIANGQYLLFQRASYQEIGGHVAVRYEAAEDLRIAQHIGATGSPLGGAQRSRRFCHAHVPWARRARRRVVQEHGQGGSPDYSSRAPVECPGADVPRRNRDVASATPCARSRPARLRRERLAALASGGYRLSDSLLDRVGGALRCPP